MTPPPRHTKTATKPETSPTALPVRRTRTRTAPLVETPPAASSHADKGWGTANELLFVTHLGTGAWAPPLPHQPSRTVLLERYRTAMLLRRDWGDVNSRQMLEAVTAMLKTACAI